MLKPTDCGMIKNDWSYWSVLSASMQDKALNWHVYLDIAMRVEIYKCSVVSVQGGPQVGNIISRYSNIADSTTRSLPI